MIADTHYASLCRKNNCNLQTLFFRIIFIFLGGPQAHDSSVEKHFQERAAEPQVPPLRCAPVGMTRERAVTHLKGDDWDGKR
jgi:hypothetical protein